MASNLKRIALLSILVSITLCGCGGGIRESETYFDADGNSVTFQDGFATYSGCGGPTFQYSNKFGKTVVDWGGCKPGSRCALMGCNAEDEVFTGDSDTIVNQFGTKYYRNGSPIYYKFRDQIRAKIAAREQRMEDSKKKYRELMKQSQPNQ